jgi:hypothetical protein
MEHLPFQINYFIMYQLIRIVLHGTKHFCIKTKLIFHNKLNWRYSEHLTL